MEIKDKMEKFLKIQTGGAEEAGNEAEEGLSLVTPELYILCLFVCAIVLICLRCLFEVRSTVE